MSGNRHSMSLQRPIKPTPSLLKEEEQSPSEYTQFLTELEKGASLQFRNVLNILTTDSELQPLILDHRKLLLSLKTSDVKAEQMLAIISAAESEMYESSKELEEKQTLITQLQLEREENERLNQKLKTIQEEESRSRRVSRIERQQFVQLRQLLEIEEEAGQDESVGSSFHKSVVSAVEALIEEAKENEARADHLREKMKEMAQMRETSISSLEEQLKKCQEREEQKTKEINDLNILLKEEEAKVKQLSTELQAVRFQREHLIEELQNQQQQIRAITGGTGSFLQHIDNLHQQLSVESSIEAEVDTPDSEHCDPGFIQQVPAPPPLRAKTFKRSVPNSVRRSNSPLYLPHPPPKTPSPRHHHLSKENVSSNRPLWTEQRGAGAGNNELERIISQQSNQLIAASYELDKLGRERYYEAKLNEQKQYYSEQQSRHQEKRVLMLEEENVELKLKLKQLKTEQQEEMRKAVQKTRVESMGEKEAALEDLYKQIFQLKEKGILLKQRLNSERQIRQEIEERASKAEEETQLIRERFKQQARSYQWMGEDNRRRALTPQPRIEPIQRDLKLQVCKKTENPLKRIEAELVLKELHSVLAAANRRQPFTLNLGRFLTDALLNKYILPSLEKNLFIFELNFSNSPLSYSGLSKLCSALTQDSTLRCLRLAHNRTIGESGFKALGGLIKIHPCLRTVDLSGTNLLSEGREVIKHFPSSASLDQLILEELIPVGSEEESLTEAEKQTINDLMESLYSSKLRKLNLSDNYFSESSLKVLLQSLPRDTIQKLYLNRIGLQASLLPYICSLIQATLSQLKALHISGNSFGSVGLGSIFSSLSKASYLVDLNVAEQKPFFLTALVSPNQESLLPLGSSLLRMRRLYLSGLNLGDQNGIQLFSSSARLLNLQILELNQNRLTVVFLEGLMKVMMDYEIELQRSQGPDSEHVSSQNQSRIRLPTLSSSPIVGGAFGGLSGSINSAIDHQPSTQQIQLTRVDTMTEQTVQQESEATDAFMEHPSREVPSLDVMSQGRGLELLAMARNPFKAEGAQILAEMVTFATLCKKLKRLDLERCELGEEGVEALQSAMMYRRRHLVGEKGFTKLRVRLENNRE